MLLLGDAANLASLSDYHDGSVANLLQALYIKRWKTATTVIQILFGFYPRLPRNQSVNAYRSVIEGIKRIGVLTIHIDAPPMRTISDAPIIALADILVPVMTPDESAINAVHSFITSIREINPSVKVAKPVLNMYSGMEPPGTTWAARIAEVFGEEPHIIPLDEYVSAARQAMEVEVLKISPLESQAIRAIIQYAKYLLELAQQGS